MDNKTQDALDLAQEIQVICKCASNENSIDDGYYKETLFQASIKAMQLAKLLENNKTQQALEDGIYFKGEKIKALQAKGKFATPMDCLGALTNKALSGQYSDDLKKHLLIEIETIRQALQSQVEKDRVMKLMVEVLGEAKELLELSDYKGVRANGIKDEPFDSFIKEICEESGYGAVMDSVARQWFLKDNLGSITTGACSCSIKITIPKLNKALSEYNKLAKERGILNPTED